MPTDRPATGSATPEEPTPAEGPRRKPAPTAAVVKKVKGRKRHAVVDTLGLRLGVDVLPANIQDRDGRRPVLPMAVAGAPTPQLP